MPHPIIVIADDLSGAAELANLAFAHGLSAEVQRQFDPSTHAQLIALDTDSRHLLPAAAAARALQFAEQAFATHPAWIFKKVDSVLRGNVRAEIEALLLATGQPRALLIPANPTRGRTIAGGQYLIDGIPLHQTSFAHDPDHPRHASCVKTLLGENGVAAIHSIPAESQQPARGIVVPDIRAEAELSHWARAASPDTLLAGAADFFAALLMERCGASSAAFTGGLSLPPPALLVCGSSAAWRGRRQQCEYAGIPCITIDQPSDRIPQYSTLLLGIGDAPIETSPAAAVARLADLTAKVLSARRPNSLLAEGGATAAAIANRLNWTRFAVVASAPAGVGVLRPHAPNAPLLLIKPGSYSWPSDIWQAFCACKG